MKFRKKPVVIEAIPIATLFETKPETWPAWAFAAFKGGEFVLHPPPDCVTGAVSIKTLEGVHAGMLSDWLIRGVQGELYPCKPDIFAATYEAVDVDSGVDPDLRFTNLLEALHRFDAMLDDRAFRDSLEAHVEHDADDKVAVFRAVAIVRTKAEEARLWLRVALERFREATERA